MKGLRQHCYYGCLNFPGHVLMGVDVAVSTWVILGSLGLSLNMPLLSSVARFNPASPQPEAGRAGQSASYPGFFVMPTREWAARWILASFQHHHHHSDNIISPVSPVTPVTQR